MPRAAIILGAAGVLPQAICLLIVAFFPEWGWVAISAACFYAAIILAFLGGMWWMQGLASGSSGSGPYVMGVLPPIICWLALLPWCLGWTWPGPSLFLLGGALSASPLVDQALPRRTPLPDRWIALRWTLAIWLGVITTVVGLLGLSFRT